MFASSILLWLLIAVGFLVLEGTTVALVSIWFAIGALAALLLALLKAAFWLQVTAFVAVSGILLSLLRPTLRKHMKITRTNVDSVIGSRGYVTEDIDNIASTGQVKLGSMTWTARSTDGSAIARGTMVQADRIEGVKVYVSPVSVPAAAE